MSYKDQEDSLGQIVNGLANNDELQIITAFEQVLSKVASGELTLSEDVSDHQHDVFILDDSDLPPEFIPPSWSLNTLHPEPNQFSPDSELSSSDEETRGFFREVSSGEFTNVTFLKFQNDKERENNK